MIFGRLFGRRAVSQFEPDEEDVNLALRLLQSDWRCSCCSDLHRGIMDLAADHPDPWVGGVHREQNSALRLDGDFLSEDFCVIDAKYFMIRCVMEFPVQGLDEVWGFGCWSTLSRENFEKYLQGFDTGEYPDSGPWFGWLCNGLKPLFLNEEPVGVDVCPRAEQQRPLLYVQDSHPIAVAQKDGLSADNLLAILQANGHGPTMQ